MAERIYNHNHIFSQAERFFSLYYEIMEENKQNDDFANYIVEFTIGTFACELYLKSIIMKLFDKEFRGPDGHNLGKLLEQLPQELQIDIGNRMHREGYMYPLYPEEGCALEEFIHIFGKGFEQYRYEHEHLGSSIRAIIFPGLLEDFTLIVRDVASKYVLQ